MTSKAIIFTFYKDLTYLDHQTNTAICNICGQLIRGARGVSSNFVTHLKRRHPPEFEEYEMKKAGHMPSIFYTSNFELPTNPLPPDQPSTSCQVVPSNYVLCNPNPHNNTKQRLLTKAVVRYIVQDLRPLSTVECEGFINLITSLDPQYVLMTKNELQFCLLPAAVKQVEENIQVFLIHAESISLTFDLWPCGTRIFLGITAHFLTSTWKMKKCLLFCQEILPDHTSSVILSELENLFTKYQIHNKIFTIIATDHSVARKCLSFTNFNEIVNESWVEVKVEPDLNVKMENPNYSFGQQLLNEVLQFWPQRMDCFAHTIQQVVRDGLNHLICAQDTMKKTIDILKLHSISMPKYPYLFGKATAKKLGPLWSSELKKIHQFLELKDNQNVEMKSFTSYDEMVLQEIINVFEPFEEATDIMETQDHTSISLAIPTITGLENELQQTQVTCLLAVVPALKNSLDTRLFHFTNGPLYIAAAALDPRFRLAWCGTKVSESTVTDAIYSLLTENLQPQTKIDTDIVPQPVDAVPRRRSLFSFIKDEPGNKTRDLAFQIELERYFREPLISMNQDPFQYWATKCQECPNLAKVARRLLSVPAISVSAEKLFAFNGTLMQPDSIISKNVLESILFLKGNITYL